MRRKSHATDLSSEEIVKDIRRATRKQYSSEKKIRIVLDVPEVLVGEASITTPSIEHELLTVPFAEDGEPCLIELVANSWMTSATA